MYFIVTYPSCTCTCTRTLFVFKVLAYLRTRIVPVSILVPASMLHRLKAKIDMPHTLHEKKFMQVCVQMSVC